LVISVLLGTSSSGGNCVIEDPRVLLRNIISGLLPVRHPQLLARFAYRCVTA
jgi:hypothetical protein